MTPEEQLDTQETPIPTWYSTARASFLLQNDRGNYIHVSSEAYKRHLKSWGFRGRAHPNEDLSPADEIMNKVQLLRDVDYSGPLAGYDAGIATSNGHRALVTNPPKRIEAKQGEWPMISKILEDLFVIEEIDQRAYFYGWLKMAELSVRLSTPSPGQALVFAGPRNAGKNLLQDIITTILGGRTARPYQYFIGKTTFNADLFEAEHLMIADEVPYPDLGSRRVFGSKIKDITVNSIQTCHGKYQNAVHLEPCWRLTISLNDEAENLVMLPPLDASIKDKIMMFKVKQAKMPMPCDGPVDRKTFWEAIKSEIPAFVHFVQNYEVPEDLKDSRFGICAFHHPDLIQVVQDMSPEKRLMELMEATVMQGGVYEATLPELEARLVGDPTFGRQFEKLFNFANALQTYMRRLHKDRPDRITKRKSHGKVIWRLEGSVEEDVQPF